MSVQQGFRNFLLLLLGAALYTLAAPPYEWSIAGWVALTPLLLVVRSVSPRGGFVAGVIYSIMTCTGITYWLYFAVASYFPLSSPLAFLLVLLSYIVFVGPYIGLAAAGASLLMRRRSSLSWLGVPALWASAEFGRTSLFSGFSWELLGYTQYRQLPLIQFADLTGVYGVSFLLALSGYVAAEAIIALCDAYYARCATHKMEHATRDVQFTIPRQQLPWPALLSLLLGVSLSFAYGLFRLQQYNIAPAVSDQALTVAIARNLMPEPHRWNRTYYATTLLQYISTTRRGVTGQQADLVVWPEFAVNFYLDKEPTLRAQLGWFTRSLQTPLLLGAPRMEQTGNSIRYYNSAYLLAPDGAIIDVYDKIRLLPFAEYRPLALPAVAPHTTDAPSLFTAGRRATIFPLASNAFGTTICYEVTYPALSRRLVQAGAQFFVNISNDTWLMSPGDAAAAQHFSMAVFRAIEHKRSLVRAATAGVSGFVDPVGRVTLTSASSAGVLIGQVLPQQAMTVYARYGDWFAVSCVSLAFTIMVNTWRQPVSHLSSSLIARI